MPKVYLRKRNDTYIEVDPQIIRWRNKGLDKQLKVVNETTLANGKSKLGRPKGKKKSSKFPTFF